MNMLRLMTVLTGLLSLTLVVGCGGANGPPLNALKGTVKYKNENIKAGTISFRSQGEGQYVATGEIKDGVYEITKLAGLPAGKYVVAISYPDPKVAPPKGDEAPGMSTDVREKLPAKYNDESTLDATIVDGPNDNVSFDLK